MGTIYVYGTLFPNSCLHGLQKLNCYIHVFKNYLQIFELDLKFMVVWKIKFKYLKINEIFLCVYIYISRTSILMWLILIN
jgi:hypothetical protein